MPEGKTPQSYVSNIVTRTVVIISSLMTILSLRDLFFPGMILEYIIPRDDIYLEWTNALYHSPPNDTPESIQYGLLSSLYIGDKFVSQLCALHILLLCLC